MSLGLKVWSDLEGGDGFDHQSVWRGTYSTIFLIRSCYSFLDITPIFHVPFSRKASIVCRLALLIRFECDSLFLFPYSASVVISAPSKYASLL